MPRKDFVLRGAGVLVVAGVLAGGGSYVVGGGGGDGGPTQANIWVDQNGGSCTRSGSLIDYTGTGDSTSCSSMGNAYAIASAGDEIIMQGGTYPEQIINNRSLGSTNVVFEVVQDETVTVDDGMEVLTGNVTIHGGDTLDVNDTDRFVVNGSGGYGMDLNGCNTTLTDIQIEDVHARSTYLGAQSGCTGGVDDSRLRFSEYGPTTMIADDFCGDLILPGGDGHVIEYNLIHDNILGGCGGAHIDAIDFDMTNAEIRGNRIWNCGTGCVFTGDDPNSAIIEHNMIEETNDPPCGGCGVNAELGLMSTMTVRYNTVEVGTTGYGVETSRPGDADVHHNIWLGSPGCETDSSGVVQVVCDNNKSSTGSGGTNSSNCTPVMDRTNATWTNTNQKAAYFFDSTDTCNASGAYGATDPLIPTDDGQAP